MSDGFLESALVLVLEPTITWDSAIEMSTAGTLPAIDPNLPFDPLKYQQRDRMLAWRDLIVGAAVVRASVALGDVWNSKAAKPLLQGPVKPDLPLVESELGNRDSTVRHVKYVDIPYNAARYADADLYGRDALIYEILARACSGIFTGPPLEVHDSDGSKLPNRSFWSLAEGEKIRADINPALPLNRDLFKLPDKNLAWRDNQLAGYAAQLLQRLKNPFEYALRLYVQVETNGVLSREPDVYVLAGVTDAERIYQAEPSGDKANKIIYNIRQKTLKWVGEDINRQHSPQLYALAIPGIETGQQLKTLAAVPDKKDVYYWRSKAASIYPEGTYLSDTNFIIRNPHVVPVTGGIKLEDGLGIASLDTLNFPFSGNLAAGKWQVSILGIPDKKIIVAGAQNISATLGTGVGVDFSVNVASGNIQKKTYLVVGGDGIVYDGTTYRAGDTFDGKAGITTYSQAGSIPSSVRQFSVRYQLSLPVGDWSLQLEYANLVGTANPADLWVKVLIYRDDGSIIPVRADPNPLPFETGSAQTRLSERAYFSIAEDHPFILEAQWTAGLGQLHLRRLIFEKQGPEDSSDYELACAVGNTPAGTVWLKGAAKIPEVVRFEVNLATALSGGFNVSLSCLNAPKFPFRIHQVQIQNKSEKDPNFLGTLFPEWRTECLIRAERSLQQGYRMIIEDYDNQLPQLWKPGDAWTPELTDLWMSLVEAHNPRLRFLDYVPAIVAGHLYEVISATATYDSQNYVQGQRFYGNANATTYTGSVIHIGAFKKSSAGHLNKPVLVPKGIYYDKNTGAAKQSLPPEQAFPMMVTCQPWMIEYGFYVADESFWYPGTR